MDCWTSNPPCFDGSTPVQPMTKSMKKRLQKQRAKERQ